MRNAVGRTVISVLAAALIAISLPTPAVAASTDPGVSDGVVAEQEDGLVRLRGTHDRGDLVLRRDESRALPFVANPYGAPRAPSAGASGGFDWSDAGIGAAALIGIAVLGAALIGVRGGPAPLRGR